jgi:hypothetical protein
MGELHSGSSTGPIVKSRKQALAIGLAEARSTKMEHGGEVWKKGSTTSFKSKIEANSRLKLMKEDDSYKNLKVEKTTNGWAVKFDYKDSKMAQGGGVGDKLPPAKIYGELLYKAISKFDITESEARKRYGSYTIEQWEKLVGEKVKMAKGGGVGESKVIGNLEFWNKDFKLNEGCC